MADEDRAREEISEDISSERIETKRKTFFLDLKRNDRGLFIKVSERSGGRRSTIMVPYEYVDEFIAKLTALRQAGPEPDPIEPDEPGAEPVDEPADPAEPDPAL